MATMAAMATTAAMAKNIDKATEAKASKYREDGSSNCRESSDDHDGEERDGIARGKSGSNGNDSLQAWQGRQQLQEIL